MKNVYENSFVHGRTLLKKLVIATVICCVLSFVGLATGNASMQTLMVLLTTVLMASAIYIMVKFCVCPHCGKHITLGVLAIDSCPRCKRNLTTGKKSKKSKQ